jgi:two-component system sensor histidine kinase ChiS
MNSSLYAENIVFSNFGTSLGIVCFVLFIAVMLAKRYSSILETSERLGSQLLRSNELKDELLLNTSHQLQTPLHGVANAAAFLLQNGSESFDEPQKHNLRLIHDTTENLSLLVRDLIDLTRLKYDDLRLMLLSVDIQAAVDIVVELLRFELMGKDVRISNETEPGLRVIADEHRLRQVLHNVAHNSVKYTSRGTILIHASRIGDSVRILVEDTGQGIASERLNSIFDYLEQGDDSLTNSGYSGLGIGLYLSRRLLERMDGNIEIERSEAGVGTTVAITLPADISEMEKYVISGTDIVTTREMPERKQLDFYGGYEYTILIVDDEASSIQVLLNLLGQKDYNVLTAFSSQEAIDKLKAHPNVDLVISDVMMPGMSGIELCREIRKLYSIAELPVLFATIKDTKADIALGFQVGANDYLPKPFDGDTLLARIQTQLAIKSSLREAIRNEIAFHQAQIKPHFLYNAISSVISFCYTDGEKAAHLLTMLSHYLRYILDMDRTTYFVPLYRELELIEAYVEIEKARFGERMEFICIVGDDAYEALIPPLSIQPFVENAIRHGLFDKDGPGKVVLHISIKDEMLLAIVKDNGVGIPHGLLQGLQSGDRLQGGIGVFNIKRRLETVAGSSLSIESESGIGTEVRLKWPVVKEVGHSHYVSS